MTITDKNRFPKIHGYLLAFLFLCACSGTDGPAVIKEKNHMVRFAKIKVDPTQLQQYQNALQLQMTTAIKLEPGVLSYYAVAEKNDPSSITILEVYADTAAYQTHIATAHFKKYKDTVKDMVLSLELVDLNLIGAAKKTGQ